MSLYRKIYELIPVQLQIKQPLGCCTHCIQCLLYPHCIQQIQQRVGHYFSSDSMSQGTLMCHAPLIMLMQKFHEHSVDIGGKKVEIANIITYPYSLQLTRAEDLLNAHVSHRKQHSSTVLNIDVERVGIFLSWQLFTCLRILSAAELFEQVLRQLYLTFIYC